MNLKSMSCKEVLVLHAVLLLKKDPVLQSLESE
jgi:hypothetical protein